MYAKEWEVSGSTMGHEDLAGNPYKNVIVRAVGNQENPMICEVYRSNNNQKRNAKLISASPDLLNACKEALEYIEFSKYTDKQPLLDCLINAINKAEGE